MRKICGEKSVGEPLFSNSFLTALVVFFLIGSITQNRLFDLSIRAGETKTMVKKYFGFNNSPRKFNAASHDTKFIIVIVFDL